MTVPQDVYECFLRHGWPDEFDKSACRAEVLTIDKRADAEESRVTREDDSDAK